MSNDQSGRIRVALTLAMFVHAACGGSAAEPAGGVAGRGAPGDAQAGEALTRDRCLRQACEPAVVPEQPDLPFLGDMGDGWRRLVELDWALAPGSEGYRCALFTLPEDVAIAAVFPQDPRGTHHVTGAILAEPREPDRVFPCSPTQPAGRRLPGSGAGTDAYEYPEGVYLPLHEGEQVHLQLHLFNPGDTPMTGRSGLWVRLRPEREQLHMAESVLVGPLDLSVPPGRSTHTGGCSIPGDTTVFSLVPHMHQLGSHMRVVAVMGESEQVLLDAPYDFDHQLQVPIEPTLLSEGDQVRVECTYDNDTGARVNWGDSSTEEMCFVGVTMYPPLGFGSVPCF